MQVIYINNNETIQAPFCLDSPDALDAVVRCLDIQGSTPRSSGRWSRTKTSARCCLLLRRCSPELCPRNNSCGLALCKYLYQTRAVFIFVLLWNSVWTKMKKRDLFVAVSLGQVTLHIRCTVVKFFPNKKWCTLLAHRYFARKECDPGLVLWRF